MNYILFELSQNKWCILFIIFLIVIFRKSNLKILIPVAVTIFCLYVNYYGIPHHDFNLTKYQSVDIEENLTKEKVIILNKYLNQTKKVLNSYNYPSCDKPMFIRLVNKDKEDEYISIYLKEGIIFKGYFLDLSYAYMVGRSFDYYIITPEIFEFLKLEKK